MPSVRTDSKLEENKKQKMAQAKRKDKAKKRVVVVEQLGQVHIKASFNKSVSILVVSYC